MPVQKFFIALACLFTASILTELLLRRHKWWSRRSFSWWHYLFFISFPMTVSLLVLISFGWPLISVFVFSAVLGTLCEWLLGFYYERIIGQKLWRYKRLNISGYTSWLVVPVWGCAGLLFVVIGKLLLR